MKRTHHTKREPGFGVGSCVRQPQNFGAAPPPLLGKVQSSRNFMLEYANLNETLTMSGYNPLLEDYENTSFFLGDNTVTRPP